RYGILTSTGIAVGAVLVGKRLNRFTPVAIQLRNSPADGKTPGKHAKGFEFFRDNVALGSFLGWNAAVVHFFGLTGNVIENLAHQRDSFEPAKLSMAGNEHRVLSERGKLCK